MNAIETILRHLDDVWSHAYESVRSVLDGVAEDEWAWQPPGYDDAEQDDVGPLAGSIAWHVAHLTACKNEYACYVRDRGEAVDLQGAEHEVPPSVPLALKALEQAHAWLRHEVEALEPADLALEANDKMKLDEFLAMAIRHDAWHGGQMALARRLFRGRGA